MERVEAGHQPQQITKGPVEGIVIEDGRPQAAPTDMPTVYFTKEGLKRLQEYYKGI